MHRGLASEWLARTDTVVLAGIVLLGAGLRLAGIGNGLPVLLYNDEQFLVQNATHISWQDLNPHLFVWGSLPFYIVKLVTFAAGAMVPSITGQAPDDFLVTRLLSTVFSLATLPLIYVLGRRISGRGVGLVAALFFALSARMVEISHYASLESMATLWTTLSVAGMLAWLAGDRRGPVLAAVSAGLAIASKYNTVLLLAPLALIALAGARKQERLLDRRWRVLYLGALAGATAIWLVIFALRASILKLAAAWTNSGILQPVYFQLFDRLLALVLSVVLAGWLLGLAALWSRSAGTVLGRQALRAIGLMTVTALWVPLLIAAGTFLIVSPYAVLDFPAFAQGAFYDLAHQSLGTLTGFPPDSRSYAAAAADAIRLDYLFYAGKLLLEWGLVGVGCMLIGAWQLWRSARLTALPVVLLPAMLILFATLGRNYGVRYLYPIWGLLALLAGIGCMALAAAARARFQPTWQHVAAALLLVAGVGWPLLDGSLQFLAYRILPPDTRPIAYDWIVRNLPAGAHVLREAESTPAVDTPELERLTDRFQVGVALFPFEKQSLSQWKAQGVEFIVLGDSRQQFYTAHDAQFEDVLAEYQRLETQGRLLYAAEPGSGAQGPPIYIYALP